MEFKNNDELKEALLLSETIQITTPDQFQLKQLTTPAKNKAKGIILYFHGGGLIFGQPDDLPKSYIDILTEDYIFISADYRLAPESKIDTIIQDALTQFDAVKANYPDMPIFVFGRSAGAFLSLMIASKREVQGILDFYGYSRFHVPQFLRPNPQYKAMSAQITPQLLNQMIQSEPLTQGDLQTRYLIYLYARGQNQWLDLLGIQQSSDAAYNIMPKTLKSFPPTFIVHGKQDPDVPFSEGQHLDRLIPNTTFIALDNNEHDFDREVSDFNLDIYQQAKSFLDQMV